MTAPTPEEFERHLHEGPTLASMFVDGESQSHPAELYAVGGGGSQGPRWLGPVPIEINGATVYGALARAAALVAGDAEWHAVTRWPR